MSKSNFVPPKLKDKNKWTSNFHSFIKHTLIKNPKRRPNATKLIQNVSADMGEFFVLWYVKFFFNWPNFKHNVAQQIPQYIHVRTYQESKEETEFHQ